MTTNPQSPTDTDLMRAAGVEKMARAIFIEQLGRDEWDNMFDFTKEVFLGYATAALAAWEGHCGWQKMDTAPMDSTPLLLFARAKKATASGILVGWHVPNLGWIEAAFQGPVGIVPTYWRHLPEFPNQKSPAPE